MFHGESVRRRKVLSLPCLCSCSPTRLIYHHQIYMVTIALEDLEEFVLSSPSFSIMYNKTYIYIYALRVYMLMFIYA